MNSAPAPEDAPVAPSSDPELNAVRVAVASMLRHLNPGTTARSDSELARDVRSLVGGYHPRNLLRGFRGAIAARTRADGSTEHIVSLKSPDGLLFRGVAPDPDLAFLLAAAPLAAESSPADR